MDVAREREDALTKNDMFWQKRINQIEVANNKSAQILEKEYNQSVSLSRGGGGGGEGCATMCYMCSNCHR